MQQKSADRSQKANNMKQHIKNQTRGFRQSDQAVTRFSKKTKVYNRTIKVNAMHQSKKSKDEIKNLGCLPEDT
jgi:predicted amidophosphoribosyltransferase